MGTILVMLVLVAIAIIYFLFRRECDERLSLGPNIIFGGVGGIFLLLLMKSCVVAVPAGHTGVQDIFGNVSTDSISAGLHLKNPFAKIISMSVRTETYTMSIISSEGKKEGDDSIASLSADSLSLPMDITIPYRLIEKDAPYIYKAFGVNFEDTILRPSARTAIRESVAKYTAQECYATKRDELSLVVYDNVVAKIADLLSKRGDFEGIGLSVDQVMLRNIDLPKTLKAAIEDKLAEAQNAEKMVFTLKKEELEAKRKMVEAKGIRDFQKTVAEGITPSYLQWKGIEATKALAQSTNAKTIVIGSGKDLPVILGGN